MDHYRERLNEEMKEQGETDRSLAKKVEEAGYPLSFTALNKTRAGTRQPSMDEVYEVVRVLGYGSLDAFLEGPKYVRIARAALAVGPGVAREGMVFRGYVHELMRDLARALQDPEAVAALDEKHPGWRTEYRNGIRQDLRWAVDDLLALWNETGRRFEEIFDEVEEDH